MMDYLQKKGVGAGVRYIANHIQPYFAPFAQSLPVTERVWKEILALPLYYDMSEEQISAVIEAVNDFYNPVVGWLT